MSFNKLEGCRFQLGVKTTSDFSKHVRLTGYGAYSTKDGEFKGGGTVEYILDTTDADDEESMRRFQRMLKAEGIIDALREAGAGNESIVRMGEWEFDFIE